eukprot:comp6207_c0_seq1/m.2034 comp6207_c0_seq1/g.2034  ORF comp6207_c0_seq1/g.2034 comp6207_c0_seq1/m.2034 type:complete len:232 (-) comp6207_c0_seq1:241-936(-)
MTAGYLLDLCRGKDRLKRRCTKKKLWRSQYCSDCNRWNRSSKLPKRNLQVWVPTPYGFEQVADSDNESDTNGSETEEITMGIRRIQVAAQSHSAEERSSLPPPTTQDPPISVVTNSSEISTSLHRTSSSDDNLRSFNSESDTDSDSEEDGKYSPSTRRSKYANKLSQTSRRNGTNAAKKRGNSHHQYLRLADFGISVEVVVKPAVSGGMHYDTGKECVHSGKVGGGVPNIA